MLAGPDDTMWTMRRAIAHSIAALDTAATMDPDRHDDDRRAFAAAKTKLEAHAATLKARAQASEDHALGPAVVTQVAVSLGDVVLDRGVRAASQTTKGGLSGKPGRGAEHVFGTRIDELTRAELRVQPDLVLRAVGRLADVADFAGKAELAADLTGRANRQDAALDARDAADRTEASVSTAARVAIGEAALALASLKGELDARFPRQREYVATFFLDVAPPRRKAAVEKDQSGGG
jgi:hypothetical protein